MKIVSRIWLAGLLTSLLPLVAYGQSGQSGQSGQVFSRQPVVQAFIRDMHERHGFDVEHLTAQFSTIRPNAVVLRAIRPPAVPEMQRSWFRYRQRFITSPRIAGGLRFWKQNEATLQRAEQIYGVPAAVIVAIIGVETEYGQNMGSFNVLEALSSLAFNYPPRADFFRDELEQFLLLSRENGINPLTVKGSYAGAIGIPQFMPGSQRRFAVDFDGDDRIDLRNSTVDAIGSVARFLQQHGWQKGAPVAVPAQASADPAPLLAMGIKPTLSVQELMAHGVTAAAEPERAAAVIDLVSPEAPTEYWLGFDNFYVITRYNRSSFYAMSVFQLAEALRERRALATSAR
ncbi:MAG TPA: lytic murein transglycosylase B [Accumulibacter sp.]|nr:lytic murein transglycosylase B [Accumulibacter sp.]HNE11809.1 lytic murein transglycosylase B [Accumulibacter sp.]HNG37838.1 lytic murein transglycosylase B [Accumulibacter sp.]HNL75902.1 lytic murein transglycosylase B [Accumulibacter sp.]HNO56152.1 lytic murein transglycosylase B [Accumulibacter sp.]